MQMEPRVWVFTGRMDLTGIRRVLGDEVFRPLVFEYDLLRDQWMVCNEAAMDEVRRGNIEALKAALEGRT